MKNKLLLSILFMAFLQISAQNKNQLKGDVARQETVTFNSPKTVAEALLNFSSEYGLTSENTFIATKSNTDKNGITHIRHQQYYKGLPVTFGMAITHGSGNRVQSVNGELYDVSNLNISPTISVGTAFTNAVNMVGATSYLWENPTEAKLMNYQKPNGELLIFPNINTGNVHLAYKFDIYATSPISREEIYVDAHTGKFLYTNPIIKHANRLISSKELKTNGEKLSSLFETLDDATMLVAAGTAATRYSGSRPIETTLTGGSYTLQDNTRGNGIFTYNCQTTTNYQNVDFTDNDNNWTASEFDNGSKDNGALDAHWGAEMTYDFWQTIFGRNSYDDAGATIKSYVHYDVNYDNAFWNGTAMTYGDGSSFDILTSLDVCGHEIGHAICSNTANLAYQNQSGAMNEGYSDIWGACIEHFGRTGALTGTPNADVWKIGEDLAFNPLRSMSDPLSRGNPDTYLGTNWTTTGDEGGCTPSSTNDQCGVHNNSGVLNHWFYILTAGKSGTNNAPSPDTYNVTGIGMVKSSEIAYLAERDYLTANSTFADARAATIAVVESLYCPASTEAIAVTDAWYAVNVGEAYVNVAKDVALITIPKNTNVNCGASFSKDITIVNGGTTALTTVDISYNIDGGTNINETWTGNLAICEQATYTLTIAGLSRGAHILNVTTTIVGDERTSNNTKSSTIFVNDSGTENVINTFTTNADALIAYDEGAGTSTWERGTAAGVTLGATAAGNSAVYGTNLSGIHGDASNYYLVSQCYDLSQLDNTFVKFDMAFDIEQDFDLMYMEYSTNGGVSWSVLGDTAPKWYNSNTAVNNSCVKCIGKQWTGEAIDNSTHPDGGKNNVMHDYEYPLSAFDGTNGSAETNIIFRFNYAADAGYAEEGVIIDNFRITGDINPALSTNSFEYDDLVIYPNPTSNTVTIASSLDLSDTKISIVDLRGRIIETQVNTVSLHKLEINLEALASGAYVLVIENGINKSVKQIIKN